jgi:hypothetical protein
MLARNLKLRELFRYKINFLDIRYKWNFLDIRYARDNYRLIIDPKPILATQIEEQKTHEESKIIFYYLFFAFVFFWSTLCNCGIPNLL